MTDYERIVSSRAVNKTAASVTGRGVHWEADVRAESLAATGGWQDMPLTVVDLPTSAFTNPASKPLLPGEKFDRLVVIGYGGKSHDSARWVVRCDCGMYGYRIAKSLRSNKAERGHMCPRCDYVARLKTGEMPSIQERAEKRAKRLAAREEKKRVPPSVPALAYAFAEAEKRRRKP